MKEWSVDLEGDIASNAIDRNTAFVHWKQWAENMRANLPEIVKNGLDKTYPDNRTRSWGICVTVGAGPSWRKVEKVAGRCPIVASDRTFPMLTEIGIEPDWVMSVDGSDICKQFFDHPSVRRCKKTKVVFNVTSHPDTVKAWKGEKFFVVPMYDNPDLPRSLARFLYYMSETMCLSTVSNVGGMLPVMAGYLGYRHIGMVGVDCCMPEGETDFKKLPHYEMLKNEEGDSKWGWVDTRKGKRLTDRVMLAWARSNSTLLPYLMGLMDAHLYNLSDESAITKLRYCDPEKFCETSHPSMSIAA